MYSHFGTQLKKPDTHESDDDKSSGLFSGCGGCLLSICFISFVFTITIFGWDCGDSGDSSYDRSDLSKRIDYITQRLHKRSAKLKREGYSDSYIERDLHRIYEIWKGNLTPSERNEVNRLENKILSEF